jgi:glycosyltransferase involved in cell wall biosynthesis
MAEKIAAQASEPYRFDVIQVEHLRGVRYGLTIKARLERCGVRLPVIWDSVDSISLLFRQAMKSSSSAISRQASRFELRRTEQYEAWLVRQFGRVVVTSLADKQALAQLAGLEADGGPVSVLKNGVDLDYFRPVLPERRAGAGIVISGKMSYHANVAMALSFVQEIMPLVWDRLPNTKVTIVGKDPPKQVWALARDSRISVTGTVDDIRPYLQTATLAAAPVAYGAGIQNKVLEAMACGAPVVSSPQAVSALDCLPGRDLLVARDPADFSQAILGLLGDPVRRIELGQAGRRYVERQHNWEEIAGQLEEIYLEELRSR